MNEQQRCRPWRKMMARGADGGCGVEDKLCPLYPVSRVSAVAVENHAPLDIGFFTQARKALAERSPFDSEDAKDSPVPTLPTGLAAFLSKHSDSRKRHKKVHSGAEGNASRHGNGGDKAKGSNIWTQTEECFRELRVKDIDNLHHISSFGLSPTHNCFLIPVLGNSIQDKFCNANELGNSIQDKVCNANETELGSVSVAKEEIKVENEQLMEIDSAGGNSLLQPVASCSSGLEWLLGSRNKIYLTSERPSKKRKLLGGDAGLEKLLIARSIDVSSSLCHYCSLGDSGDQLNRLIVCSSCGMAVHQRCYGVQEYETGSWTCSICKQRNGNEVIERPCLLCPKSGGALKPVRKRGYGSDDGDRLEFVHLFCCQWIPELYIEDTRTMEPIVNVEGIKETRKKLICYLCKVKCGACVRCSNGLIMP